jgi:uncharacterized membrane protein
VPLQDLALVASRKLGLRHNCFNHVIQQPTIICFNVAFDVDVVTALAYNHCSMNDDSFCVESNLIFTSLWALVFCVILNNELITFACIAIFQICLNVMSFANLSQLSPSYFAFVSMHNVTTQYYKAFGYSC